MFSRILVPLDGSARAEQTLLEAAHLARVAQGVLILMRAIAPPPQYPATYVPVAVAPYPTDGTLEALEEEANAYLASVSQFDSVAGIPIEYHTAPGPAAPEIVRAATDYAADLIVMSSHGRTGLARWVLGSVAQQVVRHATIPVLVMRKPGGPTESELAAREATSPADARRLPASESVVPPADVSQVQVLVPLDGSLLAETVLQPAVDIARALTAAIDSETDPQGDGQVAMHLLLVVSPYYAVPDNQPFTLLMDGAQAYLAQLAERLMAAYPSVSATWRVAVADDVATTIVRVAEHGEGAVGPHGERLEGVGTDLSTASTMIALATHGRTGFERWAMGSIAERVVATTSLPLLTVRPRVTDKQGERAVDQREINE